MKRAIELLNTRLAELDMYVVVMKHKKEADHYMVKQFVTSSKRPVSLWTNQTGMQVMKLLASLIPNQGEL